MEELSLHLTLVDYPSHYIELNCESSSSLGKSTFLLYPQGLELDITALPSRSCTGLVLYII